MMGRGRRSTKSTKDEEKDILFLYRTYLERLPGKFLETQDCQRRGSPLGRVLGETRLRCFNRREGKRRTSAPRKNRPSKRERAGFKGFNENGEGDRTGLQSRRKLKEKQMQSNIDWRAVLSSQYISAIKHRRMDEMIR